MPYQRFSRAAVVAIALREWRLFGSSVNDDDHLNWDKPERNEGLWQRIGEYWYVGMNPGAPEAHWTGKHDQYGRECFRRRTTANTPGRRRSFLT